MGITGAISYPVSGEEVTHMSVKERILTIRLMEKLSANPAYAEALGIAPEALHDAAPIVRDCSDRNMPVTEAAKLLGLSPEVVREALRRGVVDFGFAVKGSGEQYVYHISPHKLREYIGAPAMAQ
jgi:hypothetical protein